MAADRRTVTRRWRHPLRSHRPRRLHRLRRLLRSHRPRRSRRPLRSRRPRQTRRPANRPAAGIGAASMARRCQQPFIFWGWFFSTRQADGAAGKAGGRIAGATGATRVEASGPPTPPFERGPTASARCTSKPRNPRNPAVQAGFRRTASRRAEPLPSLTPARQPLARSVSPHTHTVPRSPHRHRPGTPSRRPPESVGSSPRRRRRATRNRRPSPRRL